MKKYLFGLIAMTLAIGFSAFTKPANKPFADLIFRYQGPVPATAANVTNLSNWLAHKTSPFSNCTMATEEIPCSFKIPDNANYYDQVGSTDDYILQSGAVQVFSKNAANGTDKVTQKVERTSDHTQIQTDLDNVEL